MATSSGWLKAPACSSLQDEPQQRADRVDTAHSLAGPAQCCTKTWTANQSLGHMPSELVPALKGQPGNNKEPHADKPSCSPLYCTHPAQRLPKTRAAPSSCMHLQPPCCWETCLVAAGVTSHVQQYLQIVQTVQTAHCQTLPACLLGAWPQHKITASDVLCE